MIAFVSNQAGSDLRLVETRQSVFLGHGVDHARRSRSWTACRAHAARREWFTSDCG
jgi:hypothetical protein